jgi:endonuclease/exonuclease/phosphatase (EEP) superfamily protein YafD
LLSSAVVLARLGRFDWRFDLLAHWRFHYEIIAIVLFIVFATRRQYRYAGWMMLLVFFNGILVLHPFRVHVSASTTTSAVHSLHIATANVLCSNESYQPVLEWVASLKPDVLVLVEVTHAWKKSLASINQQLPYSVVVAEKEGRGLAVYSRYSFDRSDVLYLGDDRRPAIYCAMGADAGNIKIVAAHPQSPLSGRHTRERDTYLTDLASIVAEIAGPVVLVGDLNTTPWSYPFEDLVRSARLTPGPQMPATWPAFLGRLGIPIDHILVRNLSIESLRTGPSIGSDHIPLVSRVVVK